MRMRTCSEVQGVCNMTQCASRCQAYIRMADKGAAISDKLRAAKAHPLLNISAGDYNVGVFSYAASETGGQQSAAGGALMLQNHDASNWRFTTVVWERALAASVREIDQVHGTAAAPVDACPHVDGFQVQLDAGSARLYTYE